MERPRDEVAPFSLKISAATGGIEGHLVPEFTDFS